MALPGCAVGVRVLVGHHTAMNLLTKEVTLLDIDIL